MHHLVQVTPVGSEQVLSVSSPAELFLLGFHLKTSGPRSDQRGMPSILNMLGNCTGSNALEGMP